MDSVPWLATCSISQLWPAQGHAQWWRFSLKLSWCSFWGFDGGRSCNGMLQDLFMPRSCGLDGMACNMQHFATLACTMACTMLEILFEAFLVPILRLWWWKMLEWHVTRLIHDKIMWLVWLGLQHVQHTAFASLACTMACTMLEILFEAFLVLFLRLWWWWKLLWQVHVTRHIHDRKMWLGWLSLQHATFAHFGLHNGLHNVGSSLWSFLAAHFKALMVEDALMACYKTYSW